ncbi:hypothetical protein C1Y35_19665 [Pseudomonas sp. GW456-L14]|jgi:cytochrome c biogenesis protein CcdA|uniref:superinfection immunity protein n=1 Tax=unclassified Pseudomonas TaxID=196821 RepID=UPI000C886A48|nr:MULTISPECIES: superinfection immunity protein [unclassified Pseudomonas]PMY37307.1 hypothetical protein C1Y35_19665 [Pseudomonas sp. GW456-L14]PMY59376.1 hypothetical protein C1Y34_02305 [Pseudomonas sp. GW456-L12]
MTGNMMAGLVFLIVLVVVYFIPTYIAYYRDHPNRIAIRLLNLFLGWTFLGWLACLIWSVLAIEKNEDDLLGSPIKPEDKYQQLEKLGDLKERGLLTDSEYQNEKARILG